MVLVHHVALRIPLEDTLANTLLPKWLLSAIGSRGYEAVFVFFVISGFLITNNALNRWNSLNCISPKVFYALRFARIAPCLFVLVAVLSVLHLLGAEDYTIWRSTQNLPRTLFAAFGFYLNWYEGQTGWLPGNWDVLWSLSIEEMFYLLFPLVCFLVRPTWLLAMTLTVFALSLPMTRAALASNEIWQEKAYLPGMAAIAMGVLAALVANRLGPTPPQIRRILYPLGVVGLFVIFVLEEFVHKSLAGFGLLLVTASTACLVIAFSVEHRAGAKRPWPGSHGLRALGRLSYEIYLTHMFVVYGVVRVYAALGGEIRFGFLWYIPAIALSILLGIAVDRVISTPSNRALRARLLR